MWTGYWLSRVSALTGCEQERRRVSPLGDCPGVLGEIAVDDARAVLWLGWDNRLIRYDLESHDVVEYVKPTEVGASVGVDGLALDDDLVWIKWRDEEGLIVYAYSSRRRTIAPVAAHRLPSPLDACLVEGLRFSSGVLLISTFNDTAAVLDTNGAPMRLLAVDGRAVGYRGDTLYSVKGNHLLAREPDEQTREVFDLGGPINHCVLGEDRIWLVGHREVCLVDLTGRSLGTWELPYSVSQTAEGPVYDASSCQSAVVDSLGRLWVCLPEYGVVGCLDPR